MNKKKGIVLGVCAVVVVLVGYLVYFGYNKYQESLIFREGEKIGDMDVLEGEVDTKLYTSGDYQVVEKTMKDYIVEYVDVTREIVNRLSDEKFTNLLTYENVEQDGKEELDQDTVYLSSNSKYKDQLVVEIVSSKEMYICIRE